MMPTQPQNGADRRTQMAADRTVLAAERTYAAWARTGLGTLATLRPTDDPVIPSRPSRPAGVRADCS
jgi:Domain of unknown function (DUF202)